MMSVSPARTDATAHRRIWASVAVVSLALFAACPGELDPAVRRLGSGGSAAGTGGTQGAGGVGGSSTAACDAPTMIFDNASHGCTVPICHGGTTAPELSVANVGTVLKGMKAVTTGCSTLNYVNPADPMNSALVKAVSGTTCGGIQMPIGGTPLSPAEINCLVDWISKIP